MKHNIQELLAAKDELVAKGEIIEAAEKYFAPNIKTIDFDGSVTEGKKATMEKLEKFVGSIQKVNEITLIHAHGVAQDNISFSEYIFSFEMKDGTKNYWHEIIHCQWVDGLIVEEQYFKGL